MMIMLDVAFLGTGGMMPMPDRFLASLLMRYEGHLILVDCGEGTQVALKKLGWGFKAIEAIYFTHFHADHISGLPGMLLTIGNSGRTEPLRLIGPKGLKHIVEGLRRIAPELPFSLVYEEIQDDEGSCKPICGLNVKFALAEHIVRCYSYRFEVERQGKFQVSVAENYEIPKTFWGKLQKGIPYQKGDQLITSEMVMGPKRKGISLTYITDTRPTDRLIELANGCDALVCEGMYGEEEKREKAEENRHMLFSEAAMIAKNSKAKKLILTHYSPSISDPMLFLDRATDIFTQTELGEDLKKFSLMFEE